MITVLYFVAKTVQILLGAVSLSMFVRMILSMFTDVTDNRIYAFCCFISEPFIIPVRFVLAKFNVGQDSPFDWAFFLTYLIIGLIQYMLPVI